VLITRRNRHGLATTFAVVVGLWSCEGADPAPETSVEPAELAARIADESAPIVLDVRTPEEFATGHIPGAINIPHTELADRLSGLEFDQGAEIIVHCEGGGRAKTAEAILREGGYTNVRDLRGHMRAWRSEGYPISP